MSKIGRENVQSSWKLGAGRWHPLTGFGLTARRARSTRSAIAVALTYILNQNETPGTIKALAVAFAGYVIALINTAYGLTKGR
jgi:hypothetical protein